MKCEHTYNPFEGGTLNDRLHRKNASMIADDCPWTEEELDKMIAKDTLVKKKCVSFGHIADFPDWIIGEFAEEDGIKDSEVKIECPACNGAMKILK